MAFSTMFITDILRGIDWGEAASFGATPGSFSALVKADQVVASLTKEVIERAVQTTQPMRGPAPSLIGRHTGKINFVLPMRGGALVAGGTAESEICQLLSNMGLARHNVAAGVAKVTGGSSTTITMLDADATDMVVGGWVAAGTNAGDDVQVRPIIRVEASGGTTTVTVGCPWATTPVNGWDIHPLDYLIPADGEPTKYLGIDLYQGGDATYRHKYRALGCAGTWKIPTAKIGSLPMVEFEINVSQFSESEANRSDEEDLYSEAQTLMLADSLYFGATQIDTDSIAFDPGLDLVEMPGQSGANDQGRIGWWYKQAVPKLEILPYWDSEWPTLRDAGTTEEAVYVNEGGADQFWGVCIFKTQVVDVGQEALSNGMLAAKPSLIACNPHINDDSDELPLYSICLSGV